MKLRRFLPALAAAVLPTALVVAGTAAPASADYVPAPYSGSTHGHIVDVQTSALSGVLTDTLALPAQVNAAVADSRTATNSTAAVKTSATSANVEANAAGISVTPDLRHSEQPAGPATDSGSLAQITAAPVLSSGVLNGDTAANWAGTAACVPSGTPLASSATTMASADVLDLGLSSLLPSLPDLTVARLGVASTSGRTVLQPSGSTNDVVSTATASLASADFLGQVQATITGDAVLTATSDGTTGSISYTPPKVAVSINGDPTATLNAVGDTTTATVTLYTDPVTSDTLTGTVTLTLLAPTDNSAGATGSGTLSSVLSADVSLEATGRVATLLGANVLTAHLGLLPLEATATAPAGGVQCVLPPPVVKTPADGSWSKARPTIKGTGVAGATVTVKVDGTVIGTAVVDSNGRWTLPWPSGRPRLAPGKHTVSATQALGGLTSARSNRNTFRVPRAPVISSPANGSSTSDKTPDVQGTGIPGASVTVTIDSHEVGTATVGPRGHWTLHLTKDLSCDKHVATATQTIAGVVSPASAPDHFTVTCASGGPTATTGTLPNTGAPGGDLWIGLLGMLLVGAGAFSLRRGLTA